MHDLCNDATALQDGHPMSPGGSPPSTMLSSNIMACRASPDPDSSQCYNPDPNRKSKRLSNRSLLRIHSSPITNAPRSPDSTGSPDKVYLQGETAWPVVEPSKQRLTRSDGACQRIDFDGESNRRLTQSCDTALIKSMRDEKRLKSPQQTPKGNWKNAGEIYNFLGEESKIRDEEFRTRCRTLPNLNNKHLAVALDGVKYGTMSHDVGQPSAHNRLSSILDYQSSNSDPTTPTSQRSHLDLIRMSGARTDPKRKTGSVCSSGTHSSSGSDTPDTCAQPKRTSAWSGAGLYKSRKQSLSESNLLDMQDAEIHNTDSTTDDTDSDNDKDDYGFLSYPSFKIRQDMLNSLCLNTAAMHKNPSGESKSQFGGGGGLSAAIFPKKWRRSKPASPPLATPSWSPEDPCTWVDADGARVTLQGTSLLQLTDQERLSVQRVALAKLQTINLGCSITIPKDYRNGKRSKKSGFSLKRRTGSSSLLENLREKAKERDVKDAGTKWVFGIPLGKVIANDLEQRRRRATISTDHRESFDASQVHQGSRASSCSSVSREEKLRLRKARNQTVAVCNYNNLASPSPSSTENRVHGGGLSCDSFSETDNHRTPGSNLLDALSLSSASQIHEHRSDISAEVRDQFCSPPSLRVPVIVKSCCQHIETYGLQILGIFRIGSSKKRTKQLREEFDSGKEVTLGEESNPHDVGALLKEFFRDLPDPLLTKDLYSSFIAIRKIKTPEERLTALKLLISLLPPCNRDTLWSLLKFLNTVTEHSNDSVDASGRPVQGNKMDSHNLATLFGPNILHKAKGGEFQVESLERAEERKDVIGIVQECIDHYTELFQVSAELHDEALRSLWETSPDVVALLLKFKSSSSSPLPQGMDVDSDSRCDNVDSSAPQHPTITIEMESPCSQRSSSVYSPSTSRHQHIRKTRSSEPVTDNPHGGHLGLPTGPPRLRSVSPASPLLSPKNRKPATPMVNVIAEPSDKSGAARTLASPRIAQHRRSASKQPPAPPQRHMLAVPGMRTKDADSLSSLSSGYYPGSSRSNTASPATPDTQQTNKSWYLETPPDSPRNSMCLKDTAAVPFQRTSSTQRPLSMQNKMEDPKGSTSSDGGRSWQEDNWRKWKDLAQSNSEEFQGQETLV